ncbi:thiamine phosphate synthase [Spirochaeta cellobiosiphila]|uniref:thiamine phosphate synthase n=1 Tax=Spirochaeta cellobiosiphila TaxID=504483 RepID=UPI00040C5661|nr:thiamine phosphate synthase [Spirochaeta cellobiosiphila]
MNRQLYTVASNIEEAQLFFESGVNLVQLRNKELSEQELLVVAKQVVELSHKYKSSQIIINDNIDIALKSKAYGVHLGQDDGDIPYLCKSYGKELVIGVSVDNVEEAREAESWGAHYIGAGAVFGSLTKPEAPHIGLATLKDICKSVQVPVSAIGGIKLSLLNKVLEAGAQYICVISDINQSTNRKLQIREYLNQIRKNNESL